MAELPRLSPGAWGLGVAARKRRYNVEARKAGGFTINIANALTVLRVLLVPVLGYLLFRDSFAAALWVFLIAGVSDALDGFIARVFDQRTRFGAILDPIADKLLIVASVLALAWIELLPF